MATTRRALLASGAALGTAALLAGCSDDHPDGDPDGGSAGPGDPASSGEPAADALDPADWDSVRADFLLDPEKAQLAAFVLSPHTRTLQAAIDGYRDELATDTEGALLTGYEREPAVRAAAAAYAGGRPAQYALTDSTTMGIASMYGGLALDPGDEVLSTTHDFHSTEAALGLLARRTGARVRRVTLYDDPAAATADEMVARLVAGIGPRTRVLALTWVHSSTGVRLPVPEIGAAVADLRRRTGQRLLVCVDGVHGFGAVDVALPDLGCDFLATGTHKWLFGPRGTGILWARDWTPLTELIPSFSGPVPGGRLTPGGYQAFEHQWAMADAFALMGRIGRDRVAARTTELASQVKDGLAGVRGVRVVTPADPEVSAGIVCVDVEGMPPGNAVMGLRERDVIASATPYTRSYLRLGPSIATGPEQVDAAVAAVAALV